MSRSISEWIGAGPDATVPPRVRLRVFDSKDGRCHKCWRKVRAGERWTCEHIAALINGGENRERNLGVTCGKCLPEKNAADVAEKSAIYRKRAKLGCVLEFEGKGLKVHSGVAKPGAKVAGEKRAEKKKASPNTISNALKDRLAQQHARAVQDALTADVHGDELAILLAKIVASQIVPLSPYRTPQAILSKLEDIRDNIAPKTMEAALHKRFDAKDYFPKAPKSAVLKAVAEANGADAAKRLAGKNKAAIWKAALGTVPKTGWLPPQLRHSAYGGPGGKKRRK